MEIAEANTSFFLAQRYVENSGFDIKLYVIGTQVYAVAKRSPLHPEVEVEKQIISLKPELRKLALRVGKIFGLDIYGLDVVETPQGPVIVDINDFPSFGQVPQAITLVSGYIVHIAATVNSRKGIANDHMLDRIKSIIHAKKQRLNGAESQSLLHQSPFPAMDMSFARKAR